ncbi:hypothetical protein AAG594_12780 [Citromicrobium bathyomarinum]
MRTTPVSLAGSSALLAAMLVVSGCVGPSGQAGEDGARAAAAANGAPDAALLPDLSGKWVIARIDGRALPHPIALTGRGDSLVWEPDCAGQSISYRAAGSGIEFARPERDGEQVVCEIGYPQDLPRVLDALQGRWSVAQAADGSVMLSRAGASIALHPAIPAAPTTLAGEWRVAGIDGEDFDEPYGIALSADEHEIWWTPRCAGAHVAYRISGARFEVIAGDTRPDPAAPVCKIAPPPRLAEVMDAIRAADRIERTPHNGVRLSGHGRSLTLFGQ